MIKFLMVTSFPQIWREREKELDTLLRNMGAGSFSVSGDKEDFRCCCAVCFSRDIDRIAVLFEQCRRRGFPRTLIFHQFRDCSGVAAQYFNPKSTGFSFVPPSALALPASSLRGMVPDGEPAETQKKRQMIFWAANLLFFSGFSQTLLSAGDAVRSYLAEQ